MELIVTTGHNTNGALNDAARETARQFGAPYVAREKHTLDFLTETYRTEVVLVVTKRGLTAETPGGTLFFHPNMAQLRIQNLKAGLPDHMTAAMDLRHGDSVLDCTLGLGADALVASYVAGAEGRVVGLEASPVMAAIVGEGLANFAFEDDAMRQAARRIAVQCAEYEPYLTALPDKSFDVVYFDPMFRRPIRESVSLQPMRFVADRRAVSQEAVREACRVARQRVVMKEANGSGEFARLGFSNFVGGKYSSVRYGVMASDAKNAKG